MNYTQNALNALTAMSFKGVGRAWIAKNVSNLKDEDAILRAVAQKDRSADADEWRARRAKIAARLDELGAAGVRASAAGDADFPSVEGAVSAGEIPACLFYAGDLRLLNANCVAVVGTTDVTEEITRFERDFVAQIARAGACVVSGLALGCDAVAHEAALAARGATVAILPSPIDDVLPRQNAPLARRIIDAGGLVVSEYLWGTGDKYELAKRYVERDRLQALYARSVVLAASWAPNESGLDCGARHAMAKAERYGRKRAVLWGEEFASEGRFELNRALAAEGATTLGREEFASAADRLLARDSLF